jgi:hypothetical protein
MLDLNAKPSGEQTCKGITFRGYRNLFFASGRLELQQGVRLLKSKSCSGDCGSKCCDHWMLDDINESLACGTVILPEIEHGALYSIKMSNVETDWETGCTDAFDLEIYKLGA